MCLSFDSLLKEYDVQWMQIENNVLLGENKKEKAHSLSVIFCCRFLL